MDISQLNKICSLKLIKNDCDTYLKLFEANKDSVVSMCILPYLALMCVEIQNFIGKVFFDEPYNEIFHDMRNGLKHFMDRYGKTIKKFEEIDDFQNKYFLQKIRFKALGKINAHFNLGIYLDDSFHIIGNTHQLASLFDFERIPGKDKKEKSINIGYQLGSVISSISKAMEKNIPITAFTLSAGMQQMYYIDINTNKKDTFWNNNYSKNIRLHLLHLLSFIGFVNNTLSKILPQENLWLFRLRYISCYYCTCGLNKLANKLNNKDELDVKNLINNSSDLFESRFRGCMMHYSLNDKQGFCIDDKYFDMNIPMYGLVETCFKGITYNEYNLKLLKLSAKIESLLKRQFNIDENRVKLL